LCVLIAESFLNARRKSLRMYIDFYFRSLKNESSFGDTIAFIASGITTHQQAEKVSQKLKFNSVVYNKVEWKL